MVNGVIKLGAIIILTLGCGITTLALCKAASRADAMYEFNYKEPYSEQM